LRRPAEPVENFSPEILSQPQNKKWASLLRALAGDAHLFFGHSKGNIRPKKKRCGGESQNQLSTSPKNIEASPDSCTETHPGSSEPSSPGRRKRKGKQQVFATKTARKSGAHVCLGFGWATRETLNPPTTVPSRWACTRTSCAWVAGHA
jgi:hypothetical protein